MTRRDAVHDVVLGDTNIITGTPTQFMYVTYLLPNEKNATTVGITWLTLTLLSSYEPADCRLFYTPAMVQKYDPPPPFEFLMTLHISELIRGL